MVDMNPFNDIPFLSFSAAGSTGRYMSDILGYYSASAYSISNAKHSGVHYNMMCAGLGALLTSDCSLRVSSFAEDQLAYFAFPKDISVRNFYAVLRSGEEEGENAKRFLAITRELVEAGRGVSLYCP